MRRGSWAIACLVGALAVAGCGKQTHPNDPRPAIATEVTVAISDGDVSVAPAKVGVLGSDQSISQNQGQKETRIGSDVPLIVSFTVANLTGSETTLKISGPKDVSSNTFIPNGTGNFKASLPTGAYTVRATGLPGSQPDRFVVGPDRRGSSNELLLP